MKRIQSFRRGNTNRGGRHRGRDILIAFCMILLLALIVSRVQQVTGETLTGPVRVIDGDTLNMAGRSLRLTGIDAPELGQQCLFNSVPSDCGRSSAEYLRKLVGEQDVSCRLAELDKYGRDLAVCSSDKFELNSEMVRSGQAIAYGEYEALESLAQAERAGIWAGEFDTPADWRRAHDGRDEPLHRASSGIWPLIERVFGFR